MMPHSAVPATRLTRQTCRNIRTLVCTTARPFPKYLSKIGGRLPGRNGIRLALKIKPHGIYEEHKRQEREGKGCVINQEKIEELKRFATQIRLEAMREFRALGFGHVGGAMSIVEMLAVLYGAVMNIDPKNPRWKDRDWLVMSKGHAGPALYATLALEGLFPCGRSADPESGPRPISPVIATVTDPRRGYDYRFAGTRHVHRYRCRSGQSP